MIATETKYANLCRRSVPQPQSNRSTTAAASVFPSHRREAKAAAAATRTAHGAAATATGAAAITATATGRKATAAGTTAAAAGVAATTARPDIAWPERV